MSSKLEWMRQQFYQMAEPCPEWWTLIGQNQIDLELVGPHCGIIAVALCKTYETVDGTTQFDFSANGIPCAVIEANCFRRENGNLNPYTADLVAWPFQAPDSFATALGVGEGCELLGAWNACRSDRSPLLIHQTPLGWLQSGCDGCVILKPGAEHWLRNAGGPFICEDAYHASAIRELLGHRHQILIPNSERKAA